MKKFYFMNKPEVFEKKNYENPGMRIKYYYNRFDRKLNRDSLCAIDLDRKITYRKKRRSFYLSSIVILILMVVIYFFRSSLS